MWRRLAKWLGIYILCNAVTVAVLSIVYLIAVPRPSDESILLSSQNRTTDSFARARFAERFRVECASTEDSRDSLLEVQCTVLDGDHNVAGTTYYYTRDGHLAGQDGWEVPVRND